MKDFYDFLSFRFFISPYVLFAFYYIGTLAIPVGSWSFSVWVRRKYWLVPEVYETGKSTIIKGTRKKDRLRIIILFALMFIFLEIMWRMMFEFLIAYLQMRDALLGVATY